jgi:hypothetical protein
MPNLITVLVVGPVPTIEPPMPLLTTDDPGDVPARCQYLFGDDTLAGAIHLDMFGTYLQCSELAVWTAVLPPDPDGDLTVLLCDAHRAEAQAEGITDVQPLFAS